MKETTQTVWYTGVVIGGLFVTGVIFFTVLKELFWSQSPQSIYSDALDKCCKHPKICDILGEPITGVRLNYFIFFTFYISQFPFIIYSFVKILGGEEGKI